MQFFVTKFIFDDCAFTLDVFQWNQQLLFGLSNRKKMEIKNVSIDEIKYKNWLIYFSRYDCGKSIKMLSAYYHGLAGNSEEYERKIIWWVMIIIWRKQVSI